jgi:hypothetical protein
MGLPTFKLPWTQVTCTHDGQTYQVGESAPSIDGCNSCACDESGQIACTEMACEKVGIRQTSDPLSSWESYENNVFSIKYPDSWTIQIQEVSQFKLEKTLESNEPCPIEGYESYTITQNCPLGTVAPGVAWITVEEVVNLDNIIELDTTYQNQEPWVTVDGYERKGFSGYAGIGASIYMKGFIFKKGDNGYIVSFSTADPDLIESLEYEADQILSSFEFNDADQSDGNDDEKFDLLSETINYSPKSDWQIFVDDLAGYEIQYAPTSKVHEYPGATIKRESLSIVACRFKDPKGNDACLTDYSVRIFNNYTGGSRRVWFQENIDSYKPYFMNWMIDGKNALVAIDGNPGGSSSLNILIPHGNQMIVFMVSGVAWDPDTGKVPDLTYYKTVLSTFKTN